MSIKDLTIFLPCAGLGTRLLPLTNRIPKPLIPFQGKTALEHNLEKVAVLNPKQILINTHHLPETFTPLIEKYNLTAVHEKNILGTGGCIGNMKELLSHTEYFLVHNADILHDIPLGKIIADFSTETIGKLIGVQNPEINSLTFNEKNQLLGIVGYDDFKINDSQNSLTYSGIGLYHRSFLDFCEAKPSPVIDFWLKAINDNKVIEVSDFSNYSWHDFGTPQQLWDAAKWMMKERGCYDFQYEKGKPDSYVSNEAGQKGLPDKLIHSLIIENSNRKNDEFISHIIHGLNFNWNIN